MKPTSITKMAVLLGLITLQTTIFPVTLTDVTLNISKVADGATAVIGQIPDLVTQADLAVTNVTNGVTAFEQQIKNIATAPNPLVVLDTVFLMADSLTKTIQDILAVITPIQNMITTIGDKLVKPFDSANGTTTMTVAQKIADIHTQLDAIMAKIRILIPKLHEQAQLMHGDVKKSVDAIQTIFVK